MFMSIVVALDLEQEGDRALPVAASLSAQSGVPVELLTVSSPGVSEDSDAFELHRRATANGWPITSGTVVHCNDPAQAIIDHLDKRPGALLVMSTSAKSPLTRRFLGSVSEAVLCRIDRPVLLVGPHVSADVDMLHPTLVACVDSTDAATRAVPVIKAWVDTFAGAPPWVVEVLPVPPTGRGGGQQVVESANVHVLAQKLMAADVRTMWEVLHGTDVADRLQDFIAGVPSPVLLATSTNWTDIRSHWHSTTRRLVQQSDRPVLVVPARASSTAGRTSEATDDHQSNSRRSSIAS